MHARWNATPQATQRRSIARLVLIAISAATLGCGGDSTPTTTAGAGENTAPAAAPARPKPINVEHPVVRIETNLGPLTLKLDGVNAPGTVRNFLNYATEGFYDNTLVHYVAPGKMIVAGGYSTDRQPKTARTTIRNEAHNGLKNVRGTIAMTRDPALIDSATSQFFINLEDAPQRDHQGDSADQYGYCVFGDVTDGLDVADKIAASPTASVGGDLQQIPDLQQTPDPPIIIKSIRVVP
jgi:cyclophilin family peptidyl-prolyl cis-trans isomerase